MYGTQRIIVVHPLSDPEEFSAAVQVLRRCYGDLHAAAAAGSVV